MRDVYKRIEVNEHHVLAVNFMTFSRVQERVDLRVSNVLRHAVWDQTAGLDARVSAFVEGAAT